MRLVVCTGCHLMHVRGHFQQGMVHARPGEEYFSGWLERLCFRPGVGCFGLVGKGLEVEFVL